MSVEEYKRAAALKALEYVTDGMRLGIGTGSTADLFIQALGEKVARGLRIIGVATSLRSEVLARQHGIPLVDIDAAGILDLTVDGADEIDSDLRLIKGGGGALLREKIVASASNRVLIIADETKLVPQLGAFPLPVEISPFAWKTISRRIRDNLSHFDVGNVAVALRRDAKMSSFLTDGGHYILDCDLKRIGDPQGLSAFLSQVPGVMEHGLFIGLASAAIIAGPSGARIIRPEGSLFPVL
ncbi:MAG TPA: ribose 5-phosphate isomerase A [Alphaproteobacteria bacterium]|jgi:ribose 5-phosphate isomerase A|nr:ribose 5-phosphate isomerase A [Alphaproteobacteria bacterium]